MQLTHNFPKIETAFSLSALNTEALTQVLAENYKNYSPTVECSRQNLKTIWDNAEFNPSWRHCSHISPHNGKVIHHFRSNTDKEFNGIELRFSLGLYAIPQAYERAVKTLNDLGFNVVLSTLAMMDRHDVGIPATYPDDIHDFFADRNLEIDRGHDHEDKFIIAITHSTSGTGSLKNGTDPKKVKQYMNRGVIGALDVSPFCGMSGANWQHHYFKRLGLAFQTWMTPSAKPCETKGGRIHHSIMVKKGEPQLFSAIDDPTYKQMVTDMDMLANSTIQSLEGMTDDQLKLPRVTIVPKKDSVACDKLGTYASELIGSRIHRTNEWHSPIIENPQKGISRILLVVKAFLVAKNTRDLETSLAINQAAFATPCKAPHAF